MSDNKQNKQDRALTEKDYEDCAEDARKFERETFGKALERDVNGNPQYPNGKK